MYLLAEGVWFSVMLGRTLLLDVIERKRKILAASGLVIRNSIQAQLERDVRFSVQRKG
jgi:hypothetical protein